MGSNFAFISSFLSIVAVHDVNLYSKYDPKLVSFIPLIPHK